VEGRKIRTSFFFGKPEVNRPFRTSNRRPKNDIKTDLKDIGCESMKWLRIVTPEGILS
jgi:hypothetical protein